tara:strand:- start:1014 stop:1196 length:183 start_codon:yes stop_codon:yes gene_type:complete
LYGLLHQDTGLIAIGHKGIEELDSGTVTFEGLELHIVAVYPLYDKAEGFLLPRFARSLVR